MQPGAVCQADDPPGPLGNDAVGGRRSGPGLVRSGGSRPLRLTVPVPPGSLHDPRDKLVPIHGLQCGQQGNPKIPAAEVVAPGGVRCRWGVGEWYVNDDVGSDEAEWSKPNEAPHQVLPQTTSQLSLDPEFLPLWESRPPALLQETATSHGTLRMTEVLPILDILMIDHEQVAAYPIRLFWLGNKPVTQYAPRATNQKFRCQNRETPARQKQKTGQHTERGVLRPCTSPKVFSMARKHCKWTLQIGPFRKSTVNWSVKLLWLPATHSPQRISSEIAVFSLLHLMRSAQGAKKDTR